MGPEEDKRETGRSPDQTEALQVAIAMPEIPLDRQLTDFHLFKSTDGFSDEALSALRAEFCERYPAAADYIDRLKNEVEHLNVTDHRSFEVREKFFLDAYNIPAVRLIITEDLNKEFLLPEKLREPLYGTAEILEDIREKEGAASEHSDTVISSNSYEVFDHPVQMVLRAESLKVEVQLSPPAVETAFRRLLEKVHVERNAGFTYLHDVELPIRLSELAPEVSKVPVDSSADHRLEISSVPHEIEDCRHGEDCSFIATATFINSQLDTMQQDVLVRYRTNGNPLDGLEVSLIDRQ